MDRIVSSVSIAIVLMLLVLPTHASSCPGGMLLVKVNSTALVCVDQFEAGIEVYNSTTQKWDVHPFNYVLPADAVPRAYVPKQGEMPHAYLSGVQAKAACENANKRLCYRTEFLAACQGPEWYTYPYGNTFEDGYCNTGNDNPVITIYGPNATFSSEEMNDPRLDTLPNTLAPAGNFTKCVSSWGLYDLAGNLDEWFADVDPSTGHGRFGGGYFVDDVINGPGCTYLTTAHSPDWHDYSLGTRCCADVTL